MEMHEQLELKVTQSNQLVGAYYESDLSTTEHKIIRYAISKVNVDQNNFPEVSFSTAEFMSAGGLRGNNYHEQVRKTVDELSRKRIKLESAEEEVWIPWVSKVTYSHGVVHLIFNTVIKDFIHGLKSGYTQYDFRQIGGMRSGYSIRLFELLKQYAPIKKRKLSVNVLRRMLGIEDGKYKQYGHFKSRVLNQAKKELDEKKYLTFDFEEIREGRRVVALMFYIEAHKDATKSLLTQNQETKFFIKEADYLLREYGLKIDESALVAWSKLYDIDVLHNALENTKSKIMHEPAAYLTAVMKNMPQDKDDSFIDSAELAYNNEKERKILVDFIIEHKSKRKNDEVLPEWVYEHKFSTNSDLGLTYAELYSLYQKNKNVIEKSIL